jgi:cytidylate kinase
MMPIKKIQIAVDGFSSCGKSTLAQDLAQKLAYLYIDSGAMYRAITLYALKNNLIPNSQVLIPELIEKLPQIKITFKLDNNNRPRTYLNSVDVEDEIREIGISSLVSNVSKIAQVRKKMVEIQRELGKDKGIVMDGRDIGTVVFPNAELKLFITASIEIRAKRRHDELLSKSQFVDFEIVKENLLNRDNIDQTRTESPLRQASDAVLIDNTNLTKAEQLDIALKLALAKINEN